MHLQVSRQILRQIRTSPRRNIGTSIAPHSFQPDRFVSSQSPTPLTEKQSELSRFFSVLAAKARKETENLIDTVNNELYKGLARALALESNAVAPALSKQMQECFSGCRIDVRSKTARSIYSKFLNPNGKYTELRKGLRDMDSARDMIGDALGVRIIFKKNQTPQDMLEGLEKAVEKGYIEIYDIESYHSKSAAGEKIQYLSTEKLNKLVKTRDLEDFKLVSEFPTVKNDTKNSGYIGINLNAFYLKKIEGLQNTPLKVEFQIRGALVHQFAEIEHTLYDLTTRKKDDLKFGCQSSQKFYDEFKQTLKGLNKNQKTAYQKYLQEMYEYICKLELGLVDEGKNQPKLSYVVPEVLSWKYVKRIYKMINKEE